MGRQRLNVEEKFDEEMWSFLNFLQGFCNPFGRRDKQEVGVIGLSRKGYGLNRCEPMESQSVK